MPLHLVQTLFVPATYFLVASSLHWAELLLIVRPWMCYKKSAVPQSAETERRYHLAIWSLTRYRFWIWHMSPHGLLLKRPSWISYHSMSNVWERLWGPSAVHHGCHSLRCRWCSQHVGLVKRGTYTLKRTEHKNRKGALLWKRSISGDECGLARSAKWRVSQGVQRRVLHLLLKFVDVSFSNCSHPQCAWQGVGGQFQSSQGPMSLVLFAKSCSEGSTESVESPNLQSKDMTRSVSSGRRRPLNLNLSTQETYLLRRSMDFTKILPCDVPWGTSFQIMGLWILGGRWWTVSEKIRGNLKQKQRRRISC